MTEVKTHGYLSEDCLSLHLYKARNPISNFSASVFGQLLGKRNSLGSETATRSKNHIWPRWLFSVLKTQTQSSSALGEEVKGEEKTKQNWIFNPCFSSMTTSGISQVAYAICFYSAVHLLNQQERFSCHPLPQSLKETPQELLLLWETTRTQFNLIIGWNKSSCINFYDPMHF